MDDVQISLLRRVRVTGVHQLQHFAFGDHVGRLGHDFHHALRADRSHHLKGARVDEITDQNARLVAIDGIRGVATTAFLAAVDDVVVRRNDGVPAYNLAVVIDDAAQGITEVVRGDDLAASTPSQIHLGRLLGLPIPSYAHVPLVLGPDGERLAKRHGAVTLADLQRLGSDAAAVRSLLAVSIGCAEPEEHPSSDELIERFEWKRVPRAPWRFDERSLT